MSDQADPRIDDDAYQAGRAAYVDGTTIRTIIEQRLIDLDPANDRRSMSFALGYADELIRQLRRRAGA